MTCRPHPTAQDCVTSCPSSLLYVDHHKSKVLPLVMGETLQFLAFFSKYVRETKTQSKKHSKGKVSWELDTQPSSQVIITFNEQFYVQCNV